MLHLLHECSNCGNSEERLFTDSWSGEELCLDCLSPIAGRLTQSPSEGDNLAELLNETADEVFA